MPFPLTDLKRSYGRSGMNGEPPDVKPYLLVGKVLSAQLPGLNTAIDWYEARLGQLRADANEEELGPAVGDYRLGRCFSSTLQRFYRFRPDDFEATVRGDAGDEGRRRWSRLQELGIIDSPALRLHVFDRVASNGGFAHPSRRAAILDQISGDLRLTSRQIETLVWLDREENERLTRETERPTAATVAAVYNRRALETLLVRALSADLVLPSPDGATIRLVYFLVKRHGLLCELSLVDPASGARGGVVAHLFGPLEVFGPRTRHGDRFAGVTLQLLHMRPELSGSARVLINEREYLLRLDRGVGAAIAVAGGDESTLPLDAGDEEPMAIVAGPNHGESFDSQVEARLFATLRGMERRGDTRGWHVEREPEPVIHEDVVFVPDFVLSRHATGGAEERVFVEVIGFWTPSYRRRKREKLQRLAGHITLLLVVQEQLATDFADLPFPVLPYKQRVSAEDLMRLMRREFGGVTAAPEVLRTRIAGHLRETDSGRPMLAEAELRAALSLSPADDVAGALAAGGEESAGASEWEWVAGVGACRSEWLRNVRECCARLIAAEETGTMPLDALRAAVAATPLLHAHAAAEALETLLPRLGFTVIWESLFDATVTSALP